MPPSDNLMLPPSPSPPLSAPLFPLLPAGCTGQIFSLSRTPHDLVASHVFSSSIPSLGISQLVTSTLILLDDGSLYSLSSQPRWLEEVVEEWNKSGSKARKVALAESFGLILTADGSMFSFGDNECGQRGLGHIRAVGSITRIEKFFFTRQEAPIDAKSSICAKIVDIAVGKAHALALTAESELYSWGDGTHGQNFSSVAIETTPRFVSICLSLKISHIGAMQHYSVLRDIQGRLYCIGVGLCPSSKGELRQVLFDPKVEESEKEIVSFSLGISHLIAVGITGKLFSLGVGLFGQLGLGKGCLKTSYLTPMPCGLRDKDLFVDQTYHERYWKGATISCGLFTTVIIDAAGQLYACGSNQNSKLLTDPAFGCLHALTQIPFYQPASSISHGVSSTSILVATQLVAVEPNFISCEGNTELYLKGLGLVAHCPRLCVRFEYLDYSRTVDATFDCTSAAKCSSPSLPLVCDPQVPCYVSISLDGVHFSKPLQVFVFAPPPFDEASLVPECMPFGGGNRCSLRCPLIDLPYEHLQLRLECATAVWNCEASYNKTLQNIQFLTPSLLSHTNSSSVSLSLSVSLNHQQYYNYHKRLSFYHIHSCVSDISSISLSPSPFHFDIRGCHHTSSITVRFVVEGTGLAFDSRAFWQPYTELRESTKKQRQLGYDKCLAQRKSDDALRCKLANSDAEKDEDDRRKNIGIPSPTKTKREIEDAAFAEFMSQNELESQRDLEQDAAEVSGWGRVSCISPNLLHIGPATLRVLISLNAQDFDETGLAVEALGPIILSLQPDCGPISGDTLVTIVGNGFFTTSNITAELSTSPSRTVLTSGGFLEVDECKKNKNKSSPRSASARKLTAAVVDSEPAIKEAGGGNGSQESVVQVEVPATSYTVDEQIVVRYTSLQHAAGEELVRLKFVTPSGLVLWSSPPQTFTYYIPPLFQEIVPNTCSVYADTEVILSGKALPPSAFIRIRLTLREPINTSKDSSKDNKKKDSKKSSDEERLRLEAEEQKRETAEALQNTNAPFVIVPGIYRRNIDDEDSLIRSPNTSSKKKVKEECQPTIAFFIPNATAFIPGFSLDTELDNNWAEAFAGRYLEVAVSYNGEDSQFVVTAFNITMEKSKNAKKNVTVTKKR